MKKAKKKVKSAKKSAKLSKNSRLVCDVCGLELAVDEMCACDPCSPVMCCDEEMRIC
ncbi:MAG: hypothetical protein LHV68_06325 [Elusimicrobia bacterium]|nr:hypothetical protein [Candidatus Liberimonas magnetica]